MLIPFAVLYWGVRILSELRVVSWMRVGSVWRSVSLGDARRIVLGLGHLFCMRVSRLLVPQELQGKKRFRPNDLLRCGVENNNSNNLRLSVLGEEVFLDTSHSLFLEAACWVFLACCMCIFVLVCLKHVPAYWDASASFTVADAWILHPTKVPIFCQHQGRGVEKLRRRT